MLASLFVSNHMTSLLKISNPAKHTYADDDEYVAGIKPAMARYAVIANILGVVYTSPKVSSIAHIRIAQ